MKKVNTKREKRKNQGPLVPDREENKKKKERIWIKKKKEIQATHEGDEHVEIQNKKSKTLRTRS